MINAPCERNTELQYENPNSSGLKVMAKVKVFQKYIKQQGQGYNVQNIVPSQRSCYKEYSEYTCEKIKSYLFWFPFPHNKRWYWSYDISSPDIFVPIR